MSISTSAWLILACPLVGMLMIALGGKLWSATAAATIGTLAIAIVILICELKNIIDED